MHHPPRACAASGECGVEETRGTTTHLCVKQTSGYRWITPVLRPPPECQNWVGRVDMPVHLARVDSGWWHAREFEPLTRTGYTGQPASPLETRSAPQAPRMHPHHVVGARKCMRAPLTRSAMTRPLQRSHTLVPSHPATPITQPPPPLRHHQGWVACISLAGGGSSGLAGERRRRFDSSHGAENRRLHSDTD